MIDKVILLREQANDLLYEANKLVYEYNHLPELNIKVAVLGFFSLKTRPGNCSGLYSTFGNAFTTEFKSIRCLRIAEATTFSILTLALTCGT